MNKTNLATILNQIENAYGSLDKPDYRFVHKFFSKRVYFLLEQLLAEHFKLVSIEDENDDHCYRYLLEKPSNQWILELSFVAKYAVLMKFTETKKSILVNDFIKDSDESVIMDLASEFCFEFLPKEILEKPCAINLSTVGFGKARIYQALFSDVYFLPWEQQ